jgi:hypothetical protein
MDLAEASACEAAPFENQLDQNLILARLTDSLTKPHLNGIHPAQDLARANAAALQLREHKGHGHSSLLKLKLVASKSQDGLEPQHLSAACQRVGLQALPSLGQRIWPQQCILSIGVWPWTSFWAPHCQRLGTATEREEQ